MCFFFFEQSCEIYVFWKKDVTLMSKGAEFMWSEIIICIMNHGAELAQVLSVDTPLS